MNDKGKAEQVKRTVNLHIDISGLTGAEIDRYLSSQTTPVKQWYNNCGQNLKDDEVLKIVKSGNAIVVNGREMLDDRKSRSTTDAEKSLNRMKKELKAGKSIETIRAEQNELIAQLEKDMEQAGK